MGPGYMAAITVRTLPDGAIKRTRIVERKGNRITLALEDAAPELIVQTPVEIALAGQTLLGIILARRDNEVSVFAEHQVDRLRVERILEMWNRANT